MRPLHVFGIWKLDVGGLTAFGLRTVQLPISNFHPPLTEEEGFEPPWLIAHPLSRRRRSSTPALLHMRAKYSREEGFSQTEIVRAARFAYSANGSIMQANRGVAQLGSAQRSGR